MDWIINSLTQLKYPIIIQLNVWLSQNIVLWYLIYIKIQSGGEFGIEHWGNKNFNIQLRV